MVDIYTLVENKLKEEQNDEPTLLLWEEIWKNYNNGGPDSMEDMLEKYIKEFKGEAMKEIRESKGSLSKIKSKRRKYK
ncbi:MAG: hypothetical protein JRN37_04065 [Nitrososphaerota archaeon]|jgi:hypothetical protein|nr:hypothetical protein [Nitrososphaerota archaeon]